MLMMMTLPGVAWDDTKSTIIRGALAFMPHQILWSIKGVAIKYMVANVTNGTSIMQHNQLDRDKVCDWGRLRMKAWLT
jgi:hypothetical protein